MCTRVNDTYPSQLTECHCAMHKYMCGSNVTKQQAFWFTMCIKPGGVPDKLCVFPADES